MIYGVPLYFSISWSFLYGEA